MKSSRPDASGVREKEQFTELPLMSQGVGVVHVNRFICYFTVAQGMDKKQVTATQLLDLLLKSFSQIFDHPNNVASVKFPAAKKFQGARTAQFIVGGTLGGELLKLTGSLHHDWVSIVEATGSFYAKTLQRNWRDGGDQTINAFPAKEVVRLATRLLLSNPLLVAALNLSFPMAEQPMKDYFISINQRHFLAGRRSWVVRLVDAAELKSNNVVSTASKSVFALETAAIERNSSAWYTLGERFVGGRKPIVQIWGNLLFNFIHAKNLKKYGIELQATGLENPYTHTSLTTSADGAFEIKRGYIPLLMASKLDPWIPAEQWISYALDEVDITNGEGIQDNALVKQFIKHHPGLAAQL